MSGNTTPADLAREYNALRERALEATKLAGDEFMMETGAIFLGLRALPPLPVPPDVPEVGSRWVQRNKPENSQIVLRVRMSGLRVRLTEGDEVWLSEPDGWSLDDFLRDFTPAPEAGE